MWFSGSAYVKLGPVKFFFKMRTCPNKCQGPVPGRCPAVEKHWCCVCVCVCVYIYICIYIYTQQYVLRKISFCLRGLWRQIMDNFALKVTDLLKIEHWPHMLQRMTLTIYKHKIGI
jgi:hypothetical protein